MVLGGVRRVAVIHKHVNLDPLYHTHWVVLRLPGYRTSFRPVNSSVATGGSLSTTIRHTCKVTGGLVVPW